VDNLAVDRDRHGPSGIDDTPDVGRVDLTVGAAYGDDALAVDGADMFAGNSDRDAFDLRAGSHLGIVNGAANSPDGLVHVGHDTAAKSVGRSLTVADDANPIAIVELTHQGHDLVVPMSRAAMIRGRSTLALLLLGGRRIFRNLLSENEIFNRRSIAFTFFSPDESRH